MQILPTWDLFILVFFAIIIAYSFIIGRNSTLKIIISTYIAILTADGFGNIVDKFILSENPVIDIVTAANTGSLVILKILIFVLVIVLLAVRGSFFVATGIEKSVIVSIATTGAFGFLSAGLIIATILVYISGGGFMGVTAGATGIDISSNSELARMMTENYNLWFSLPALAFVVASFVGEKGTELDSIE